MNKYILLSLCLAASVYGQTTRRVCDQVRACNTSIEKRNYKSNGDLRYMLQRPTAENLVEIFMQALKARNLTKYVRFIRNLTEELRPTDDQIETAFRDAVQIFLLEHKREVLAQQEPIKETEIHYIKDEIEGQERENLIRHIHIAQRAIREYEQIPEDLIFALAAIGYLTGLLEGPQTRQFVDVSRNELVEIEKRIVTQMEGGSNDYKEATRAPRYDNHGVQDAMSVQDKTVITKEGDRIYTKKIKRIQVKDS